MKTINAKSPEKIQKIIKETISTFIVLAAYLGIRDVENELISCCKNFIQNSFDYETDDLLAKKDLELLSLILQTN